MNPQKWFYGSGKTIQRTGSCSCSNLGSKESREVDKPVASGSGGACSCVDFSFTGTRNIDYGISEQTEDGQEDIIDRVSYLVTPDTRLAIFASGSLQWQGICDGTECEGN